jgi:hypothetical protein
MVIKVHNFRFNRRWTEKNKRIWWRYKTTKQYRSEAKRHETRQATTMSWYKFSGDITLHDILIK